MATTTTAVTLEARIQRLEDLEDIRNITIKYAQNINKGWHGRDVNPDAMPDIFTDDVIWESSDMGIRAEGLKAIMEGLVEETAINEFSMHTFVNPVIELDGDSAKANWLMWIGAKSHGAPRSVYLESDFAYRRTGDGWRIAAADMKVGMVLIGQSPQGPPPSNP